MIIKSSEFVKNPIVSVIIPSYNRANTIGFTIDSILLQNCNFDFEIVIGEDSSTDNTREVLKEYQAKYPEIIKLLFYEHNIGLGPNWATCVMNCKGKYIANCDNDDYWHNQNKLQLQVDFLEANFQYGVIHTDYRNHNRNTGKIEEVIISNTRYEIPLQQAIFTGKFKCCNATVMYRKELIDKYVNLDDYINLQFTLQDWNTWVILSKYTEFYCIPISTATFGIETESITRPKSYEAIEQRFNRERVCYEYVCNLFPDDLNYDISVWKNYVSSVILNLAYLKLDFKTAKKNALLLSLNGDNRVKIICAKNIIFFHLYFYLQKIKSFKLKLLKKKG